MLHTLHRSPRLTDFAALLRLLSEGDELLLLQDGVTAAVDGNRYLESLRNAPIKVYALNEDLIARGLTGQISNDIIPIDYTDFVRLTVKHSSQMARDGGIVVYFLTPFRHRPKNSASSYCVRTFYYVFTKQKLKPGAI